MKALFALVVALVPACAAVAADDAACEAGKDLIPAEVVLSRSAAAIARQHSLAIIVLGTASSMLPGSRGERAAYPARLEGALNRLMPGVSVKVTADVKPRHTAAEMKAQELQRIVDERPALVIWQTGTVDAIRGVDPDDFRTTLDEGVEMLQAQGVDVVFMNMQYSPRTDAMISSEVYADTMRWVALQREVPLFDRLALMKQWSELGTFDLYAASKDTDTAERVHDCIGRLLADLIVAAVKDAGAPHAQTR